MDSDSIFYIVIAVIIAIVNAIAQSKKKKAMAAEKAPVAPANTSEIFEPIGDTVTFRKDDPLHILLDKGLYQDKLQPTGMPYTEEEENIESSLYGTSLEQMDTDDSSLEEVWADPNAEKSFNLSDYLADYKEAEVESSTTHYVQPGELHHDLKEAAEADSPFASLKEEFDVRKAILYSEIINPKYFSIHPKINH